MNAPPSQSKLVAGSCRLIILLLVALSAAAVASCRDRSSPAPATRPITLFAAASTADALGEAIKLYESRSAVRITPSFAATSTLAQQIRSGAPADLFVSADEKWMDDLAASGLIDAQSRVDLLAGDLVLIAPRDHPFTVRMSADFDFAGSLPGSKRVALADPASVPAGRYARQALEHFGWWPAVKDRLIPALDVREALRLVELGEADAGIVYSTDAVTSPKVSVIAMFPPASHTPITYPAALVRPLSGSSSSDAQKFLEFLRTPDAAAVFAKHGFRVPSPQ